MTAKRKQQYKVVIYPDWCKGCGICAAFCPKKVLAIDHQGKARADRENECINCGFCELHCPDFAIVVRPRNGADATEPGPDGSAADATGAADATDATGATAPRGASHPPQAAESPEPKRA